MLKRIKIKKLKAETVQTIFETTIDLDTRARTDMKKQGVTIRAWWEDAAERKLAGK